MLKCFRNKLFLVSRTMIMGNVLMYSCYQRRGDTQKKGTSQSGMNNKL